jgi:hypothetical protein
MELRHMKAAWVLSTALGVFAAGALAAPPVDIANYEGAITADDLFIVDCLLPGQVRQLGQNFTYVAPRRPIRTAARDCARRGGEYVAYDRANYETALKVWQQAAESGDADAQVHVGEIYEKGLGVDPNFAEAARWYQKAAEQGHSRAMINLGNLYEGGRGVPKDMTQAMNWYRKASGLTEGFLEFTTEDEMAQRRALAREAEELRAQVESLTQQLDETNKTMARRQRDLRRARTELEATIAQLEEERAARGQMSEEERQALEQLRVENEKLRSELRDARLTQTALEYEIQATQENSESAELELARTQDALAQLKSLQKKAKRSERDALKGQEVELQQALAEAQQKLEAAQQREAALKGKLEESNYELDSLTQTLAVTQGELSTAQRELANSDETLELLMELEAEIADKESEIAQYEETTTELLAQLGVNQVQEASVASAGDPMISMISPEVVQTRGIKSVTLFSDVNEYELIGRVTPKQELIAFRVNDQDAIGEIDDNGLFKVRVAIASDGDTPVNIEAVREDGSTTTESFLIQQDAPDAIALRTTTDQFRKRLRSDLGTFYALVIGNTEYPNHPNLQTAGNDAQTVADSLRDRYGFDVRLLLNASRDQMVIAMANMTEALGKNDNLLIYYAGHGVVDDEGEGYWLPVDASAQKDKTWIGNAQISDFISEMQAKHVLVVADSCYSGTLSGTSIRPIPLDVDDQDLLFISRVKARTVLTSGGLQPVIDDGGTGHSIFGGAFIRAISDNGDVMEGFRLYESIRDEVVKRSRLARVPQDPEYTALKYAGHEGSEFFFLPASGIAFWDRPMEEWLFASR